MPLPIPAGPPPQHVTVQPYYLRERQDWAIGQQRQKHAQALYQIGEWAMYVLMWHVVDFEAGLVDRCTVCYSDSGTLGRRITDVYDQPTRNECPGCFGTTFEGGYRARIVRPTIFTDTDEEERPGRRGTTHNDDVNIETVWDFRVLQGDYVIRADNSRWQLGAPQRVTLRTGFQYPSQLDNSVAYRNIRAAHEEPNTVAYSIPPIDPETIRTTLATPMRYPADFSAIEDIRSPLIPLGADTWTEVDFPEDDMYPSANMYPGGD